MIGANRLFIYAITGALIAWPIYLLFNERKAVQRVDLTGDERSHEYSEDSGHTEPTYEMVYSVGREDGTAVYKVGIPTGTSGRLRYHYQIGDGSTWFKNSGFGGVEEISRYTLVDAKIKLDSYNDELPEVAEVLTYTPDTFDEGGYVDFGNTYDFGGTATYFGGF